MINNASNDSLVNWIVLWTLTHPILLVKAWRLLTQLWNGHWVTDLCSIPTVFSVTQTDVRKSRKHIIGQRSPYPNLNLVVEKLCSELQRLKTRSWFSSMDQKIGPLCLWRHGMHSLIVTISIPIGLVKVIPSMVFHPMKPQQISQCPLNYQTPSIPEYWALKLTWKNIIEPFLIWISRWDIQALTVKVSESDISDDEAMYPFLLEKKKMNPKFGRKNLGY